MMRRKQARQPNGNRGAVGSANTDSDSSLRRGSQRRWIADLPSTIAFEMDGIEPVSEPSSMEMSSRRGEVVEVDAVEARVLQHLVASPLAVRMRHLNGALESLGQYVCTSGQLAIEDEDTRWVIDRLRCVHGDEEDSAQRLADALESAPGHSHLLALQDLVALYGFVSRPFDEMRSSFPSRDARGGRQQSVVDADQIRMAVLRAAMRGIRAAFHFRSIDQKSGLTG